MVAVLSIAVSLAFVFNNVIVQAQNPQVNCNSQVSALLPCLGYVQGQVNQPPQSCCSGLSSVVKASPFCLCSLIATGPGSITGINSTLALELPTKCNMKGLDPRLCSGILGVPVPAPSPLNLRAPIASGPVANQSPVQSPITPAPAPVLSSTAPRAVSPVSGPTSQSFVPVASPKSPVATLQSPAPVPSSFTGSPASPPSQAVTKASAPSPRHHRGGHHGHKRHPKAPVPAPATSIAPAEAPVVAANPIPTPSSSPDPSQNEALPVPPVSIVSENAPTLAPTAGGVSNAAPASAYCVKVLGLPVAIAFSSLVF